MSYSHQCRFCTWAFDHGCIMWCDELEKEVSIGSARRPNQCKSFVFNEIPADGGKPYKPRKVNPYKQMLLMNIPTDKQRVRVK